MKKQMYAKFSKCEFRLAKGAFSVHCVSKEGVPVHPAKIQAVSKCPGSKNVSDIKSFLGLAGY